MIDLQLFFSKKSLLAAAGIILTLLLLQFFIIRQVGRLQDKYDAIDFETKTLDRVFKRRSDTVMKYKKALNFNYDLMPVPVESPTHFYAFIISTISSVEIKGSEVTKVAETKDIISFAIKGEADYFSLLDLLSSLRQSPYMMRLTDLSIKSKNSGIVTFSFNVQGKIADPEKENIKKAAGAGQ